MARMLYDHSSDPEENFNISETESMQKKVKELSADLKKKRGAEFIKE
jgi:hypothetical protein